MDLGLLVAQKGARIKTATIVYFVKNESSDSTDSDERTEDLFGQYFVDPGLAQKNRKKSLKCGNRKNQNSMRNNVVMNCFDCGSSKQLAFHGERPDHMERMKKRSGILDGVRK